MVDAVPDLPWEGGTLPKAQPADGNSHLIDNCTTHLYDTYMSQHGFVNHNHFHSENKQTFKLFLTLPPYVTVEYIHKAGRVLTLTVALTS